MYRINDRNLIITLVAMDGEVLFSRNWAAVLMPSLWGILVYRAFTSRVTRIASLGTPLVLDIFRRKAPVSLMYEGRVSAIGCR